MGFMTPKPPSKPPAEILAMPFFERLRYLASFWSENGFGSPIAFHTVYIVKLAVLYVFGGLLAVSLTSDVGSVWHFTSWWDEPIVYQKLVLWTVLIEAIGLGGTWGPLCGHFKPMTGGIVYWLRPGTLRSPPWGSRVPGTAGDTRTVGDVLLYAALLASLVVALVLPGVRDAGLSSALPDSTGGLVRPEALVPAMVLLVAMGLRDKVIFLSARGEQYLPILLASSALGFVDMIVAFKIIIVVVWIGAGVSKFGHHFVNVVPPMVSNAPWVPKALRLAHYRDTANGDFRPSRLAWFMAHVLGTLVELAIPLILLFSTNTTITLLAVAAMVLFHAFILSTFPLAVPLEWNLLFGFAVVFLFAGYPAGDGYGLGDVSQPWLIVAIALPLLFFPALGNLRPDLVSFLPSMRQYAGNWATSTWVFRPGIEERLNELGLPAKTQVDQLEAFGFDRDSAEVTMQTILAWRAMHSQGRGLYSVLARHVDDLEGHTIREGEFVCNVLIGWNFGDGHLHDERLVEAVQRRLGLQPGDLRVVWAESQAIHRDRQDYRVIDAALGVVERGSWRVADAVAEQPWLPNGPIDLSVEWIRPGYTAGDAGGAPVAQG